MLWRLLVGVDIEDVVLVVVVVVVVTLVATVVTEIVDLDAPSKPVVAAPPG